MQLRYNLVKQLPKSGIISIDYVKSERNLRDPQTKGKKYYFRNIERNGT